MLKVCTVNKVSFVSFLSNFSTVFHLFCFYTFYCLFRVSGVNSSLCGVGSILTPVFLQLLQRYHSTSELCHQLRALVVHWAGAHPGNLAHLQFQWLGFSSGGQPSFALVVLVIYEQWHCFSGH